MPTVSSNTAMGFGGSAAAGKIYGRQIVPEAANRGTISQDELDKRFGVERDMQGAAVDHTDHDHENE